MLKDYNYYNGKYSVRHRRCIDGRITGSNKCSGYCECNLHPGFLTRSDEAAHKCREKGCHYYLPKMGNGESLTIRNLVQTAFRESLAI